MNKNINISNYKNFFFIGIGGIGMSALAKYFSVHGKNVSGYDKVKSVITNSLESNGIAIHFNDDVSEIPTQYLDATQTLIIYTPAIPSSHKEFNYFKENGFILLKRATILGLITNNTFSFAVAGTHGKTTTSAILGHILKDETINATSFLGGIASNYNSNLILGDDKISVVEADEYDRSFLQLSPNYACITTMDADHLDIYGEADELEKSFLEFANEVTDKLFYHYGLPITTNSEIEYITYGLNDAANYQAIQIRFENGMSVFNVKTPTAVVANIKIQLPGEHNVLNTLATIAMANSYGISMDIIKQRLASFKGIERRFNIKINTPSFVLVDDYAHHPTEINAVYKTIKELYPTKNKLVVFQPHLFSRTQDFADNFATSLSQFDDILLLDIYPARELPIKGVTSHWLAEKIEMLNPKVQCVASDKKEIIKNINTNNTVVAMLGAGDIGVMIGEISKQLAKTQKLNNEI